MRIVSIMKKTALAALLGQTLWAQAADWSNDSLGLKYSERFREPGISAPVTKTIVDFTHASGDQWGRNLLVAELLQSDGADPAAGGSVGAQEIYGFYRRTFSLSKLSGMPIAGGPVKDVSLVARFDRGAKNTQFAPAPRKLYAGASVDMAVDKGYLEVGAYAYRESNHNGIVGKAVDFRTAPCIDAAWSVPVHIGHGSEWRGIVSLIGAKGPDGFGNATRPETQFHTEFLTDLGHSGVKAGLAYELWRNKFGTDHRLVPGANYNTAMLVAEYHF